MIRNTDNDRDAEGFRADVVAIVTGGSSGTGRQVARALASWGWAIVVVYLEHQRAAETTLADVLAADGTVIAVRADLTDDLDVQRLFAESTAAFAGVDVVVHTTTGSASLLYQHAARHVRPRGAVVSISAARARHARGRSPAARTRNHGRQGPARTGCSPFLDGWRQQASG